MANKSSKSREGYAAAYKTGKRWEANRKRRLLRTLKNQPNNKQVELALQGMVYRRKTPTSPTWTSGWIRIAKLFKEFTGRFDPAIMSANPEVSRAALARPGPKTANFVAPKFEKNAFSLGARLHN